MIEQHDSFKFPTDNDKKIWRYLDFTKFVDLLNSESLFFSRADKFDDIFEGSLPKKSVTNRDTVLKDLINRKILNPTHTPDWFAESTIQKRMEYAINCWHLNDYESTAMWKVYLKSNEGIAVQSTFSKLKSELNKSVHKIFLGIVNYKNYEQDYVDWSNSFNAYVHKRESFSYENELRALIWDSTETSLNKIDLSSGGIKIPVDLTNLVENIYVSPKTPYWLTSLVKATCIKFGFNFIVNNSRLDDKPMF